MRRKSFIPIIALVLTWCSYLVAAEPSSTPKPEQPTGIEGTISVGPIHAGPSRQGIPDSRPLANFEFLVKKQEGVVTSFKTDDQGHFRISLPAGHYTISRKEGAVGVGNYSFEVDLVAGQMKVVHWDCDTGIR